MAYDPNDPADKKIVADAVKAALETQAEEHEAEVERLTNKNTELLGKLRKAREGGESSGEVERLENELSESQGKLRKAEADLRAANRSLGEVTTERDTAVSERDTERQRANNEFVGNRLTSEFAAVNVGEAFRGDLTDAMRGKVTVKEVNGERNAFVGDKTLTDYVKEWAGSDKGKHYVIAPNNSGGNAAGGSGNANGGAKKISEMNATERVAHFNAIGEEQFNRQVEAEKTSAK